MFAPVVLAQDDFGSKVYPVLESAGCRGCHVEDGVASGTRLHFPEANASRDRVQAFGITLVALVDKSAPSKSLLLNKPTARIAHTGGERIKPGSPEDKILSDWVRYLATVPDTAVAAAKQKLSGGDAGSQPDQFVRRMTHSQYNNTVRDLLGDYSRPADRFPPEDFVDGFKNQLRTQGMSPLLVDAYSNAAERLAKNAFRAGDINNLVPCKPASATDLKCRDAFIRKFGERAYRRPLTEAEVRRYTTLFSTQARTTGMFLDGARVVLEVMLQSPKFLFLTGTSGGYDTATRLSYYLWNSTPDRALLDSAAKGELNTPQGIDKSARRMLEDPRAKESLAEFFNQWLRLDRALNAVKDRRRFPEFSPELAAMSVEETRRLLERVVWEDRNFMEVFTANYGFLTADLARLYNAPAPTSEYQLVSFPPNTPRAGLLGQISFLASTAGPVETSPTARGIFVREQLLCQHIPSPPPGVNTNLPEPTAEKPQTRRQRMMAHVENPTCASCHKLMDPIGFGFEHFDGIGKFREKEVIQVGATAEDEAAGIRSRAGKQMSLDLDASGSVAGLPNSSFSDPKQLGNILANSQVCQECVVRQVFRYAYGRMETSSDQDTIQKLFAAFKDSGFHFKDLVVSIVKSPVFSEGRKDSQVAQNKVESLRRLP